VGPRAGLDEVAERKNPFPAPARNWTLVIQSLIHLTSTNLTKIIKETKKNFKFDFRINYTLDRAHYICTILNSINKVQQQKIFWGTSIQWSHKISKKHAKKRRKIKTNN
jgi:hypothetical protein